MCPKGILFLGNRGYDYDFIDCRYVRANQSSKQRLVRVFAILWYISETVSARGSAEVFFNAILNIQVAFSSQVK